MNPKNERKFLDEKIQDSGTNPASGGSSCNIFWFHRKQSHRIHELPTQLNDITTYKT